MVDANRDSYWRRRANTWVTLSVLGGGLVVGFLLAFMYQVENSLPEVNATLEEEQFFEKLREKGKIGRAHV